MQTEVIIAILVPVVIGLILAISWIRETIKDK